MGELYCCVSQRTAGLVRYKWPVCVERQLPSSPAIKLDTYTHKVFNIETYSIGLRDLNTYVIISCVQEIINRIWKIF